MRDGTDNRPARIGLGRRIAFIATLVYMSGTIKQSELRNDNAAIMRRVAAGERFTVTVNGAPVADLVPHQRETRRRQIPAAEVDALLHDLPPIDVEAWHRDSAEIDDLLDDAGIGPSQQDDPR